LPESETTFPFDAIEVAHVQRFLKTAGVNYSMHAAGTTLGTHHPSALSATFELGHI
jgi:uncharacterized protein YqgV (UPF0045/DUF77 family)